MSCYDGTASGTTRSGGAPDDDTVGSLLCAEVSPGLSPHALSPDAWPFTLNVSAESTESRLCASSSMNESLCLIVVSVDCLSCCVGLIETSRLPRGPSGGGLAEAGLGHVVESAAAYMPFHDCCLLNDGGSGSGVLRNESADVEGDAVGGAIDNGCRILKI